MEHEALGPFFLARRFGAGGMGEVYLAFGPVPNAEGVPAAARGLCVVKMMKKDLMVHEQIVRRFEDEARLLAALRHKNIAALYDAGYVNDVPFMSLEFISGVTVKELLRLPTLPQHVRAHTALCLLGALAAAHEARGSDGRALSVVHRDVSPQNVMVDGDGVVKLIDFGIAHFTRKSAQTRPGQFVGKMKYAPPEQLLGDEVDARADVFAAGVLITELFAGQRFYARLSDEEAARAALDEEWSSPSLNSVATGLGEVLRCATARDPADRFASARVFERALQASLGGVAAGVGDASMREFLRAELADELRRLELVKEEALLSARQFFQHRRAGPDEVTMVSVVEHTPPVSPHSVTVRSAPSVSGSLPGLVSGFAPHKPALEDVPTDKELQRPQLSTLLTDASGDVSALSSTPAGPLPTTATFPPRAGAPPTTATLPPRLAISPDARTAIRREPSAPMEPVTAQMARPAGPTSTTDEGADEGADQRADQRADDPSATIVSVVATPAERAWAAPTRALPPPPAPSSAPSTRRVGLPLAAGLAVAATVVALLLAPGSPLRVVGDATTGVVAAADAGGAPVRDAGALALGGAPDAGAVAPVDAPVDAGAVAIAPVDAGALAVAPVDAGVVAVVPVDAGTPKVVRRPPRGPPPPPPSEAAGALQRMLKKAKDQCRGVPACAGLPANVDAASAPLDELLALRQRARACLEACER